MSDTLMDPVSPTLTDVAVQPSPAPRRGCVVASIAAGLALALLVGVGLYLYFVFWRYEPTAQRHVPAQTTVALRIDPAELVLFKPFRTHLMPLIEGGPEASSGAKPAKNRIVRLKEHTGVDLSMDVRELILATVDAQSWVLLIGGRIQRGRFVRGLESVLREEGRTDWKRTDE